MDKPDDINSDILADTTASKSYDDDLKEKEVEIDEDDDKEEKHSKKKKEKKKVNQTIFLI